jgi:hypothetical protein
MIQHWAILMFDIHSFLTDIFEVSLGDEHWKDDGEEITTRLKTLQSRIVLHRINTENLYIFSCGVRMECQVSA